jgi:hypothetical protein
VTNAELDKEAMRFVRTLRKARKEQLGPWIEAQVAAARKGDKKFPIGGELAYKITPTNLGVILTVECEATGESLDLTDFSDW